MYKRFGELADLSRAAVAGKPLLKLDVQPRWTAVYLEITGDDHPILIGEVPKESAKIKLNPDCLKEHFNMTEEEFLAQRRRR